MTHSLTEIPTPQKSLAKMKKLILQYTLKKVMPEAKK